MKHFAFVLLLLVTGSRVFAGFGEAHWRWRKNDGSETSAAWRASQDFPATIMDPAGIRLRVELYNSLGNNETGVIGLQYRVDSTGHWISISNVVVGHDFVLSGTSPFVTDGQTTTMQVNDPGAGTFEGGKVLVSTYRFRETLEAGARKEYEWCIKPTGSCSRGALYQFRMTYTGTADLFEYGSPTPDMMIRPDIPLPGAAGIYRDSSVTGFFDRDSGWIASDGCTSIPLSDGRVLWTMGDSYIGNYKRLGGIIPCLFQVRNCVLVQPKNNWYWPNTTTLIGDSASIPSYFKNNSDNNYLMWPVSGYQRGDTIYVYCANIMNASGGLGFKSGGNDFMAKVAFPSLKVIGFDSLQNFNGISFGQGFDTTEPGTYIYTWGAKGTGFTTGNVFVARFPRSDPAGPWSFWNGTGWDTAVTNAAVIATSPSNATSIAKVRNKFVIISTAFSVGCDQGRKIYCSTSDNLMGPFSPPKTFYTIPDNVLGHTPFFYSPVIHPEYINARGDILITYDINGYGPCEPFCINNGANPDYYRPRGIRVPLSSIDPTIARSDSARNALLSNP